MKEACELCAKKNRKCNGEKPECSSCKTVGLPCVYVDSKKLGTKQGRSTALEERLKKLEAIVQALHLEEHSISDSNKDDEFLLNQPSVKLPSATGVGVMSPSIAYSAIPAHIETLRPDLEEVFLVSSVRYTFLTPESMHKAISESSFLRYVIYAISSTVAPLNLVTSNFSSRQEMGQLYFSRAESMLRKVFRKPSYHTIIGLMGLVIFCTRTNKAAEAFYYYTVAVRISFSIGLNKEREYEKLQLSEDQKEIMRRTWWTVYLGDRILSSLRFEPPMIRDEDCLIHFPADPSHNMHPQDRFEFLSIGIMSSTDWFVPSPRGLSIQCYLIILLKIETRIISMTQDVNGHRSKLTESESLYRIESIAGSLRDWYASLPENLRNVHLEINGDLAPSNPDDVWFRVFIMFLYHCIKIFLRKRALIANVRENGVLAATSSAAKDIFLAGCDIAVLLQGFLTHNPNFYYCPPFIASCIFGAFLMVLVVSRLNLNPNDLQLLNMHMKTYLACLNQHIALYNIGADQKGFIERLQMCQDPVLLVMALSSLKNLKGDMVPTMASGSLLTGDDSNDSEAIDDQPPMTLQGMRHTLADSALLESVAQMSNPYTDLMFGLQVGNDPMFDQLFNFPETPK